MGVCCCCFFGDDPVTLDPPSVFDLRDVCVAAKEEEESDFVVPFLVEVAIIDETGRTFSDDETSLVDVDAADDLDRARGGTMCDGTTCLELARISFAVRGDDLETFNSLAERPPSPSLSVTCISLESSPSSAFNCAGVNATPASITLDAETTTPPGSSMSGAAVFSFLGEEAEAEIECRDGDMDAFLAALLLRGEAGFSADDAFDVDWRAAAAAAANAVSPIGLVDELIDVDEEGVFIFELSDNEGRGGG